MGSSGIRTPRTGEPGSASRGDTSKLYVCGASLALVQALQPVPFGERSSGERRQACEIRSLVQESRLV